MIDRNKAKAMADDFNKNQVKDQLKNIEILIERASLKGKYSINVTEILTDNTINILREEGFTVESGGRPGEKEYIITWKPLSKEELDETVKWIYN